MIYPQCPDTFWSFSHALKFISRKSFQPPLGLLTVAAMLPVEWDKRLVDMNTQKLDDKDLMWADYVFLSAMSGQKESARNIIKRCRSMGIKVVAGGLLFTNEREDFADVDHLVLNEAEITLPVFLNDIRDGKPRHLYTSDKWADITTTPVPLWELINPEHYASMNIQYSKGCPFECEFCNIATLYGRVPRTKNSGQVIAELEKLYELGWRGGVFFVDDNFIGNRKKLKEEILPSIIRWMDMNKHPFNLSTEASINLADDEDLMRMMARAGFSTVFVGIESPHEESLVECTKIPNKNRDLLTSVRKLQNFGLEVQAGFIVGFDKDPVSIFETMIKFIQESGIVIAKVSPLNAPRGTKLYDRLASENRLLNTVTEDNMEFSMNFIPRMDYDKLISGHEKIIDAIYSPKHYNARIKQFMREYKPVQKKAIPIRYNHLKTAFKSVFILGIIGKERFYFWSIFFWSLFRHPKLFPLAITFSIYRFHMRKVFEDHLRMTGKKGDK